MSRCGKTHLLDAAVQGELPDEALREHAAHCPRCRHELQWLETERRLFRERAARDEVQHLWKGVVPRVEPGPRGRLNRALVGVAATLLLLLGGGRLLLGAPVSSAGLDASIVAEAGPVTEGAFSPERGELCSRPVEGVGFHCGYLTLASR
ncbi:MAG: hypothetical protein JNJ54_09600 [Myxococcaceae bacterium]|nr:hypothetical protein [Myxococcaceae bacterium]